MERKARGRGPDPVGRRRRGPTPMRGTVLPLGAVLLLGVREARRRREDTEPAAAVAPSDGSPAAPATGDTVPGSTGQPGAGPTPGGSEPSGSSGASRENGGPGNGGPPRPAFPLPPLTGRPWREESIVRSAEILTLSDWLNGLPGRNSDADRALDQAIRGHVAAARDAAADRWPPMRNGARLARAASNLDAAEATLLRRAPLSYLRGQLPSLHTHVRRHLPADDPRRVRVEQLAREARAKPLDEVDRETLVGAVRAACSAAEREQRRVRSFVQILVVAIWSLGAIALTVGVLAWFQDDLIPLCFQPQETTDVVCPTAEGTLIGAEGQRRDVDEVVAATASQWDVPLVQLIGTVSAAATGAVALRRLRGTSSPFGVPVALIALKLPTGALTAFLGLLLMRGGFVPGLTALDSTPQILAWAVVFGAGQQLFTGLVDRQAQTVLDSVSNKTYVPSGGS